MQECFICTESTPPLYRVCACESVVHEQCYRRLLTVRAHETQCAVCTQPYDLRTRFAWKVRCNLQIAGVLLSGLGIASIGGMGVMMSHFLFPIDFFSGPGLFFRLFMIFVIFFGISWFIHVMRVVYVHFQRCCVCVTCERVVVDKQVHLPQPQPQALQRL